MIELHYYNRRTSKEEVIQLPKDHITKNAQIGDYIDIASYMKQSVENSHDFVRKIREITYNGDVKKIIMSSNLK
jgi:hypothetical protein